MNPELCKFNNSIIMQLLLIMMITKHEYVARIDLLIPSKIIHRLGLIKFGLLSKNVSCGSRFGFKNKSLQHSQSGPNVGE